MNAIIIIVLIIICYVIWIRYNEFQEKKTEIDNEEKRKRLFILPIEEQNDSYPIIFHCKRKKINGVSTHDESVKKGWSEYRFTSELKKHLSSDIIFTNRQIGRLCPDITIEIPNFNFYLVLEIDEKYDLEFRNPIHYDTIDNIKNKYYNEHGFHLIRLTEEQVLFQTKSCVRLVAEIIAHFTFMVFYLGNLKNFSRIKQEKKWSKAEVRELIKKNYREKMHIEYLNSLKIQQIKTEDYTSEIDDLPF